MLSADEKAGVLRYYHVRDAKMALGSALLKRYIIAKKFAGHHDDIGWSTCKSTRDEHTKPVFYFPPGSKTQPLLFNVSHQAGLVAMLAVADASPGTQIGIDIVCPGERRTRDHESIRKEGWPQYVCVHDSVFSPEEAARLTSLDTDTDERLGYFYALWCIREAYVKMTGEALLASWLRQLDVRYFAPPEKKGIAEPGMERKESELEVWFQGNKVQDAKVKLEWLFGKEYMVCTAVKDADNGDTLPLEDFKMLDIETVCREAETIQAMYP